MKLSDSARKIIGAVAPALATALGGPLAGAAVKVLSEKLLGRPDASEEELEAAIPGADPNKILEAQTQLKRDLIAKGIRMEELDVERDRVFLADVQSARNMATSMADRFVHYLACGILSGFFITIIATFAVIQSGVKLDVIEAGLLGSITGYVSGLATMVASFYFGSSRSSKSKDEALAVAAMRGTGDGR